MNTSMLLIWLTGALAGSMLFFAVVIAPTVFRALPAEAAGNFLRRLFPLYFLWGLVMSLLCTITAMYAAELIVGSICAMIAILFAYARYSLLARINRARERKLNGDATAGRQFKRLHLQSVLINAAQFLLLIGISFIPD
jgi:Ca2+/Na+ antiporter